jgi:hypothetical protein
MDPVAADLAWSEGWEISFDTAVALALSASEEIETQG